MLVSQQALAELPKIVGRNDSYNTVLMCLIGSSDDGRMINESEEQIAKKAGLSLRTVKNAIKRFIKHELLVRLEIMEKTFLMFSEKFSANGFPLGYRVQCVEVINGGKSK